jgi:predicted TIM-barrel fold metal-dependent hydrolase
MDENPNVIIDFSARIDELGRQPYAAREFLIKYSKRVIFGTDMIVSPEMYRCYFRFLETKDECFDYPDYIGRWGHSRWGIYGLYLPDDVLENIYYKNICALIPEMKF